MAAYRTSAAGGGTSGTTDRTVTITPAVGDLFVVLVSLTGNTNASATMTDNNGGTYTRIASPLWGASANIAHCFVRTALLPNTTSTIITCASGSNTAGELVAVAVSGMAKTGAAAVRSSGTQANGTISTAPAPALNQAALTGNVTLAAVASGDTTTSPNASWTERQDVSQTTPVAALEVGTRDSGFTGTTITFAATQATDFASFAIELDGSIAGTLSKTLADLTRAIAGTVDVTGTTSGTLGALTLAATGTVEVTGSTARTLGALTLDADATVTDPEISGVLNRTLATLTLSASVGVEIAGSLAKTLGALSLSSAGTVAVAGTTTATLGTLARAITATVEIGGATSRTLGNATTTATATVEIVGTLTQTLEALSVQGTAAVAVTATLSRTLAALTLTATAGGDTETITGSLGATLGTLTCTAMFTAVDVVRMYRALDGALVTGGTATGWLSGTAAAEGNLLTGGQGTGRLGER